MSIRDRYAFVRAMGRPLAEDDSRRQLKDIIAHLTVTLLWLLDAEHEVSIEDLTLHTETLRTAHHKLGHIAEHYEGIVAACAAELPKVDDDA